MFLIDDILFSPVKGIVWAFKEIHKAAVEDAQNQSESITQNLRSLYMQLETGKITEEEFSKEETRLLDELDKVQAQQNKRSQAASG